MEAWSILAEARSRAGISQRALAQRAGTSQSVVARIERGRTEPSVATLSRLVEACGFDVRIRLEPHDEHDDVLRERLLALSAEERIRRNGEAVNGATRLRAGARDAR